VTDLARGGFVIDTPKQGEALAAEFAKAGLEVAEEPYKPTPAGYADKALQIRSPNGLIGEIQIVERGMYEAKNNGGGHATYKEQQKVDPKTDPERFKELGDKMRAIYGKVTDSYGAEWRAALGLSAKKQLSAVRAIARKSA
jgi:hypothetical protein